MQTRSGRRKRRWRPRRQRWAPPKHRAWQRQQQQQRQRQRRQGRTRWQPVGSGATAGTVRKCQTSRECLDLLMHWPCSYLMCAWCAWGEWVRTMAEMCMCTGRQHATARETVMICTNRLISNHEDVRQAPFLSVHVLGQTHVPLSGVCLHRAKEAILRLLHIAASPATASPLSTKPLPHQPRICIGGCLCAGRSRVQAGASGTRWRPRQQWRAGRPRPASPPRKRLGAGTLVAQRRLRVAADGTPRPAGPAPKRAPTRPCHAGIAGMPHPRPAGCVPGPPPACAALPGSALVRSLLPAVLQTHCLLPCLKSC